MKHGYKVVAKPHDSDELLSAWWGTSHPGVRYKVGEKTAPEPNCGPLCAFQTKDNAERFVRIILRAPESWYSTYEIWECDYEEAKEEAVWYDHPSLRTPWQETKAPVENLPEGTVLADSIILIKKLPSH